VTVHGFRSTFRDWVAEKTYFPGELAEIALAHSVGSVLERAYKRTDLIARVHVVWMSSKNLNFPLVDSGFTCCEFEQDKLS
jgi:hypothetical protein